MFGRKQGPPPTPPAPQGTVTVDLHKRVGADVAMITVRGPRGDHERISEAAHKAMRAACKTLRGAD